MNPLNNLQAEAEAFNERISTREQAGYIPDLRRAVRCEYFYKSFWRDPHFVHLYLGENVRIFLELLQKYGRPGLRILDVGCGAGYISLELARAGHHVLGIDIAESAIASAQRTLATNPFADGFGSLEYKTQPLAEAKGEYDAIVFSGVIHHFENPKKVIKTALDLLPSAGLVLCHEPCHESWREADAAQVGLIRGLLALTGRWYEGHLGERLNDIDGFSSYVKEVHLEYVTEKDPQERGQSPNDNAASGAQILDALQQSLKMLEYRSGSSFIYRLLGGLRGPAEETHAIADFITTFERYSVREGFLRPNHFFFIGRKT